MNLHEIATQAEASINAIREAERLLKRTYGAGCSDFGGIHPDAWEIDNAARALIVHLSWLKARAVALALMPEASDDAKKKFGNLVR